MRDALPLPRTMGRSKAESGYIEGESVAIAVRSAEAQ
jgi:hypothetical protein